MKYHSIHKQWNTCILFLLALMAVSLSAANMEIVRLSDTMIIVQEGRGRTFALNTAQGIVVIDTRATLCQMRRAKELIETEFKRHDYAFVINTHDHWEHMGGNGVFERNIIIAHEGLKDGVRQDQARKQEVFTRIERDLGKQESILAGLEPNSPAFQASTGKIAQFRDVLETLRIGAVEPIIVFNDRLTLELGERTVKLIFYGQGHSRSDILVYIPQEKVLLTGGACSLFKVPPLFQGYAGTMDVARWIVTLSEFVDSDVELKYIIPGHAPYLTKEDLRYLRDYYRTLWEGLNQARLDDLTLDEVKSRFSLEKRFAGFNQLANPGIEAVKQQNENIEALWAFIHRQSSEIGSSKSAIGSQ